MASRIRQEEKSLPGLNFILFLKIPIKIDISSTIKFKYDLEDRISERNLEISEALRQLIFGELGVHNDKELLVVLKRKQPQDMDNLIKRTSNEFKSILDRSLNIPLNQRSKFFINKCKEIYFN